MKHEHHQKELDQERNKVRTLQTTVEVLEHQIDRLQRGSTIESDFITKHETELMKELEDARSECPGGASEFTLAHYIRHLRCEREELLQKVVRIEHLLNQVNNGAQEITRRIEKLRQEYDHANQQLGEALVRCRAWQTASESWESDTVEMQEWLHAQLDKIGVPRDDGGSVPFVYSYRRRMDMLLLRLLPAEVVCQCTHEEGDSPCPVHGLDECEKCGGMQNGTNLHDPCRCNTNPEDP